MPTWVVKASWIEDDAENSEQWEIAAATAEEAVRTATARLSFPPHHVEARCVSEAGAGATRAAAAPAPDPARN